MKDCSCWRLHLVHACMPARLPVAVHLTSTPQAAGAVLQGKFVASRVLNRAIQYASAAVAPAYTWKRMKAHVPDLLRAAIFPLACFDDEDARLWAEDPHEYIRKVCLGPGRHRQCRRTFPDRISQQCMLRCVHRLGPLDLVEARVVTLRLLAAGL